MIMILKSQIYVTVNPPQNWENKINSQQLVKIDSQNLHIILKKMVIDIVILKSCCNIFVSRVNKREF